MKHITSSFFYTEDWGKTLPQNIGNYQQDYMASLLRRPQSTFSPMSEPQTTYSINHSFIVPLGNITYTKVIIFWQSPQGLWQYVQCTSNQTGRKSTLHELTVIFNWLDSKDPVILDSDLNCQKDKQTKAGKQGLCDTRQWSTLPERQNKQKQGSNWLPGRRAKGDKLPRDGDLHLP